MISKRLIPIFLLKGKRLVKGTNFSDFIDVGDPISQGMIYDAQGAEEIMIVDINASSDDRLIDTSIVNSMITKCRLPISVGGGIKNLEDARKCFAAGGDKIVLNSYAIPNPSLIRELSNEFGSQSVLVSIDVKKNEWEEYDIYIYSGTKKMEHSLEKVIDIIIKNGAGEIILTSIDQEGNSDCPRECISSQ